MTEFIHWIFDTLPKDSGGGDFRLLTIAQATVMDGIVRILGSTVTITLNISHLTITDIGSLIVPIATFAIGNVVSDRLTSSVTITGDDYLLLVSQDGGRISKSG
jgi:hypothetical protein